MEKIQMPQIDKMSQLVLKQKRSILNNQVSLATLKSKFKE